MNVISIQVFENYEVIVHFICNNSYINGYIINLCITSHLLMHRTNVDLMCHL